MDYLLSNRWLRWLVGAHLWCMLGNSSTKQTTITNEYANSFNETNSYASSFTGGDTTLTLGGGTGSGTQPLDIVFVIGAIGAFLAGLFMLKGKN